MLSPVTRLNLFFFSPKPLTAAAGGRKDFDVGSQAHTCDSAAGLPGAFLLAPRNSPSLDPWNRTSTGSDGPDMAW
jgi:hypothetical protein